MQLSKYFLWFFAFSFVGWVYESTYCTIVERKWANRGFLYGPVCPIYGFAATAGLIALEALEGAGISLSPIQVFLISMVGSAILEYVTSWGLEKLFHARWWDYTEMPFNLNGRICLPASVLFGFAGLLVAYVLYGPSQQLVVMLGPVAVELLALVFTGIISADTAITVSSLNAIAKAASDLNASVNDHMDRFVASAFTAGGEFSERVRETRDTAASMLAERRDAMMAMTANAIGSRAAAISAERERFAASLRESRLGTMSRAVRSAASRVYSVNIPTAEGESSLRELREILEGLKND